MEAVIKSLNPEACDDIDNVFGDNWRLERSKFYEDGAKMYDVSVDLSYVSIETDEDDVILRRGEREDIVRIYPSEYLAIVIR